MGSDRWNGLDRRARHSGIERARQYIVRNFHRDLRLEEVAEAAFLSKYYFSKLFHREMGITYQKYLACVRVERAKELLRDEPNLSVGRVARRVGFQSVRTFHANFRRYVGTTPTEYRHQHS